VACRTSPPLERQLADPSRGFPIPTQLESLARERLAPRKPWCSGAMANFASSQRQLGRDAATAKGRNAATPDTGRRCRGWLAGAQILPASIEVSARSASFSAVPAPRPARLGTRSVMAEIKKEPGGDESFAMWAGDLAPMYERHADPNWSVKPFEWPQKPILGGYKGTDPLDPWRRGFYSQLK